MDFTGIDKFSLLDYDGLISIVLFMPGCNFRCPFCHNIESVVDSKTSIPFDEILAYLKERKNVIDAVVISGGEPTLDKDLINKIKQIKEIGYLVKLDTNGTNPSIVKQLVNEKIIDYVAMDIKNSPSNYHLSSGVNIDLNPVLETISFLKENNVDYEFRTTLVDEHHSLQDIIEISALLKGSKKLYLQKYVYRDGVINKNLHPVSLKKATEFKEILSKNIDTVELRGY
ncbi:MAG: anaerobic ribonucleoside-triphosphate reductase activating protein [Bacilli bacterium]|nr:anaerobic ribonucleoside-triphosphate reductase activating protein [Bacilli bacterium]